MVQRILDTNRLILHWRRIRPKNASDARRRAHELIALFGNNGIVTPVAIEFVGGTRSAEELRFARAFLSEFRIADQGRILSQDFDRARELAERVPRDGRPRGFADCLIRAIADRLHYDVGTGDRGLPRSLPPGATGSRRTTRRKPRGGGRR